MKYLLENEYAPTTFRWGFVESPFDEVIGAYRTWMCQVSKPYGIQLSEQRLEGGLNELLEHLYPVVSPRTRQMLIETNSHWTAYFDNASHGGDPISAVGQMCDILKCRGVAVTCCPHRHLDGNRGVFGTSNSNCWRSRIRPTLLTICGTWG